MSKTAYIGHIKNEQCDVKTIVMAENEAEAMQLILAKFKDIEYSEQDVTICLFSDVHGSI